jgi:tetratricopeptide (TPR) repeat protein
MAQETAGPCNLAGSMSFRQDGAKAMAERQYNEAIRQFQSALDACPARYEVLLDLAQAHTHRRDLVQAVRAAEAFLEKEPSSVQGRILLGNAYLMSQRLPEALERARQALAVDPKNAAALKLKGNAEYLGGKTGDAIATFLLLLEAQPNDSEAAYMLGRIYYQDGRIDYAIGQFQRVLRIAPKSFKAYDNLGLCYQARGETELAIRHFLTAIRLVEKAHPDYDWPYANLASLLVDEGDARQAFAAASKAADRNPYSARNFFLGGKALHKLGKLELAMNWLERSVALDPEYADPLYLLGRVYAQLGQEPKAKEALQRFRAVKAREPRSRR